MIRITTIDDKIQQYGFVKTNDRYIPYSIHLKNDNKDVYFCLECARGITKNSMLSELNKLVKDNINDINKYYMIISKYNYEYIPHNYDTFIIIYVCNKEYSGIFMGYNSDLIIDSNKYTDLD